jgi:two-component system CheB/CheR fusion protein
VLEHGLAVSDFEVELNRARKRILSLSARRIAGDAERGELILLTIEDITERRARTDLPCEDCRRKDEFLAVLAHELRSPLGIVTYAVHLLKRTEGDEAAELRELLARQTLRLVRIVDDLLDVARISRGLIGLKRVPLDLVPLVRNVASACDGRLRECGHMLSVSVPEGPVCIDGDAVRIEQVVSNLLENAIKYTDPGGRIALTLSEADGAATISVADNGIGLAPESLERIFELFAQVKSSRARSKGGLGLGLSVAHRVLEMHGGWIEARSAGLGQGSEFIARIPLLPAHKAPGGQEAAEQDSRAAREAGFDEQVVKTVPPEWLASLIAKGR